MEKRLLVFFAAIAVSGFSYSQDANSLVKSDREYYASQDGKTIYDKASGLVWMRCTIGHEWNGKTCQGRFKEHSHAWAMQAAGPINAVAYGGYRDWTLPSAAQLLTLRFCSKGEYVSDRVRAFPASAFGVQAAQHCAGGISPVIDPIAFPYTVLGAYRTSSISPMDERHTVYIDFHNGLIRMNALDYQGFAVRLVRKNPVSPDIAATEFPVTYASMTQAFEDFTRANLQRENEAKELKAKEEAEKQRLHAQKETEQRAQAAKAEAEFKAMFPRLGRCIVGESVTHRELLNASQSSGNALADIIWNSHTKAQYVIEYEAVVEGFVGSKVKTTINGYQVKQLKAGSYVDGADMRSRVAGYADKLVGKTQFYDRSRCSK